jgi:hypothetical protein
MFKLEEHEFFLKSMNKMTVLLSTANNSYDFDSREVLLLSLLQITSHFRLNQILIMTHESFGFYITKR